MRIVGLMSATFLWCFLPPDPSHAAEKDAGPFKAGVASRVITPKEPLWMGGYSSRNKPAEEKQHDVRIKALALEDAKGERLVLVTSDLLGFPRELSDQVAEAVRKKTGPPRERLMLTSHP